MDRRDRQSEQARILERAHRIVVRRWTAGELSAETARSMLEALEGHLRDAGATIPTRPADLRSED